MANNDPQRIGVGMLGYAFMGKAHSSAFLNVRHVAWPPPSQLIASDPLKFPDNLRPP